MTMEGTLQGPLAGLKVVELATIGPAPFCCMMLADMGAEVIRVDRLEPADLGSPADPKFQLLNRGRRSAMIDLKKNDGVQAVMKLVAQADILIEGFRPGVMERLGLGPDDCFKVNPGLVYGRMTGWGQDGPLAQRAGHDINYIALAGALGAIGPRGGAPVPPLNLVGDYGGGSMFLAFGVLCAIIERQRSGKGQVIDAAMVDGVTSLLTGVFGTMARGGWRSERGTNMLDGGAPWYRTYETRDRKYISIGSIEGRFYRELLDKTGLAGETLPAQHDRNGWPLLESKLAAAFKTKTRDEWTALLSGTDVCFAPVLDLAEVPNDPHMAARGTVVNEHGLQQPAPAPRFSRSRPFIKSPPAKPGEHTMEVLADWGFDKDEVAALVEKSVVR